MHISPCRAAVSLAALAIGPLLSACGDVAEPSPSTRLPPDATQPVNSMTQDSANVPGGGLDPQPPSPENP